MTNKEKIDCLARGEMLSKQQLSQLLDTYTTVSYTHLTLPTKLEV